MPTVDMVGQSAIAAYLLIWGIAAILVALDADERGENKLLWGGAVFVFSVLGVIPYFALVLSPEPDLR